MCGIAGWYNRDGCPVDPAVVAAMSNSLIHRGPDDEGLWCSGKIALAHRRLAIRDLSAAGRQPMSDIGQRVFVTYNGEIYNDHVLRAELERDFGVTFHTSCDTEILPYAYLAWGDGMFARLEGMFAIALWDVARERLVLARDGIGIKPVLFVQAGEAVLFASEMKGILASGIVQPEVSARSLHTFFAAGYAGPASTLVSGVEQVAPGSVVAFTRAKRQSFQFWRPSRCGDITDVEQAIEALSHTLNEVVGDQLISDVPLSILQSGGIDSSLVSLTVGRRGAHAPLFTASFTERSHDEVNEAASVARTAGLPHEVIPIDTGDDLCGAFRAMVHHFDGQCADTGALGFYCLSQAVRRHSTVVLSGDGGDEFFCGYETYTATRIAAVARHVVPSAVSRSIGELAYYSNPGDDRRLPLSAVIARFMSGLAAGGARAHLEWRRLLPAYIALEIYGPQMRDLANVSPYSDYAAFFDNAPGGLLDRAMLADQQFHIQSVLNKVDAMSMAHSLEVRVPLLDRRIMDLAGRIPVRLMNQLTGAPKNILRVLAKRLGAPSDITKGRKKGFNVPISNLLRRELRPLADQALDRDVEAVAPYLDPERVRALWRAHRDGSVNHAFALWPVLTFAVWRAGLATQRAMTPTLSRAATANAA